MDSNRPKLLILTSSFPASPGDETSGYIRDFARSVSREFNVRVLAPPDVEATPWPSDVFILTRSKSLFGSREPFRGSLDLNAVLERGMLTKLALLLSVLSFALKALRLARTADVICSHWLVPSGLIGTLIAWILRRPHIVLEHSGALNLLSHKRGGRWVTRFVVSGTRTVIVVSAELREKLIRLCPDAANKVEVIPMGITIDSRVRRPDRARQTSGANRTGEQRWTLLFIGRLVEVKGLEVLLRALHHLKGYLLVVAGEGERREHLEAVARKLKVNAIFLGRVDAEERERLLDLADVVVVPSIVLPGGRTEGMPLVCLEALAAGRPVIASRVGGLPEIITGGENGLLVEPGDDKALCDAIKLLFSDPILRQRLAGNGRLSAARFNWADAGNRFNGIIKGSLRNGQKIDGRGLEPGRTSG